MWVVVAATAMCARCTTARILALTEWLSLDQQIPRGSVAEWGESDGKPESNNLTSIAVSVE